MITMLVDTVTVVDNAIHVADICKYKDMPINPAGPIRITMSMPATVQIAIIDNM